MTRKKVAEGHAAVNRCYKDTVFRMLFADKENLLSLYNAMNGKSYTNPDELEIVTLENAIYMEMKNDLAFIVDTRLYLYEHQSTFNPNIPLRDLLYISCEYQRSCVKKSLSWAKKKGREEGRKEGLEKGHEKGAHQMAILCQRLLADNRVDDLERCTEDAEYRKLLMAEYGVTETAPVA